MGCGVQCVFPGGTTRMLEWCVENWDTMDVSCFMYIPSNTHSLFSPASKRKSYTLRRQLLTHITRVDCKGNETNLIKCDYTRLADKYCRDQAGVSCHCE